MSKRPEGQTPLVDAHPKRFWVPDIPGHKNKRGVVVNKETKKLLKDQIERLKLELGIIQETSLETDNSKIIYSSSFNGE